MTDLHTLTSRDYPLPDDLLQTLHTPTLAIWLDLVRANLDRMERHLSGDLSRWRPHLKTTKMPLLWAELLARGVRTFKCATLREARELLGLCRERGVGETDLLIAHPLTGPGAAAAGALAREFTNARISVLAEDPRGAAALPPELGVFVDLNPGMDRTGIPLTERREILATCRAAGSAWRGLHCYEGHICSGSAADRRQRCHLVHDELVLLCRELAGRGLAPEEVITSGTPAFLHALDHPGLADLPHRVSPGTVVLHDGRSSRSLPELELTPAALVIARVVSRPGPDLATCDAGSKSIPPEGEAPSCLVVGRPDLQPCRPSEEHLPIRVTGSDRPDRGDLLRLLPWHICTTVNMADQALVMEGGTCLGLHPVTARGHDC